MEIRNLASDIISRSGYCETCTLEDHFLKELNEHESFEDEEGLGIWGSHNYKFESGSLKIENSVSADGINDVLIYNNGRLVYRSDCYDSVLGKETREQGSWEEELRILHGRIFERQPIQLRLF